MTILHTEFIVHWTGRDFHVPINSLDDNLRDKYIQRLIDTLENGFFMKIGTEKIYDLDCEWIQASISILWPQCADGQERAPLAGYRLCAFLLWQESR